MGDTHLFVPYKPTNEKVYILCHVSVNVAQKADEGQNKDRPLVVSLNGANEDVLLKRKDNESTDEWKKRIDEIKKRIDDGNHEATVFYNKILSVYFLDEFKDKQLCAITPRIGDAAVTFSDNTQSIFLGVFLQTIHALNKWSYKDTWASITATGTFVDPNKSDDKLKLEAIDNPEAKFNGEFQDFANAANYNDKRPHLFLYISKDKSLEARSTKNIKVKTFSPDDTVFDVLDYVFKLPCFPNTLDDKQKEFFNGFENETKKFQDKKTFIPAKSAKDISQFTGKSYENQKSFLIYGPSGTGKSYLAFQISRHIVWNNKRYTPIWIAFNSEKAIDYKPLNNGTPLDLNIQVNNTENSSPAAQIWDTLFSIFNIDSNKLFNDKQNTLFEKLTKENKPYLIIINGLAVPQDILDNILKDMTSLCKKMEKNNGRVIFTSTMKYSDSNIRKTLGIPHSPTRIEEKEFKENLNDQLDHYPKAKIEIERLKEASPERYDHFTNLLYENYGSFPGIVESILGDLELSSDTTIGGILKAMEISSTGRELTGEFSIHYKKSFDNLSLEAKCLLLYLLNFNFYEFTSPERLKEDIDNILNEQYKKEYDKEELEKTKEKMREVLKLEDDYESNKTIDELANAKFICTDDNTEVKEIRIVNPMAYKTLLFEDDFSVEGLREKLVSEKRILKITVMDYFTQNVDPEKKSEILKLRLNRLGLKQGLNNIKYEGGCNIIHGLARFCDDMKILEYLWGICPGLFYTTKNGKIIPVVDDLGQTAFHYAASENSNPEILEWFLTKMKEIGINDYLNFGSKSDNRAIHFAAEFNKTQAIMEFLLRQEGILINEPNKTGLTPLHYACWKNTPEIVDLLLKKLREKKVDITKQKTNKLHNIVHLSVYHSGRDRELGDTKKVIDTIIQYTGKGPFRSLLKEKDENGDTPLHYAVFFAYDNSGNKEMEGLLRKLYYFGSNLLNEKNNMGYTPIYNAVVHNSREIVSFLVKKGANIYNLSYDSDKSTSIYPIHYAAWLGKHPENLEILCGKNRKLLNIQAKNGWTPLHYALEGKNYGMINKLVNLGASKDIPDERKFTPLHRAVVTGQSEFIDLLVTDENLNSKTSREFDKLTPLLLALNPPIDIEVKEDLVRSLLKHNPNVEIPDVRGCTPLHYAVKTYPEFDIKEKLDIIEKLITKNTINSRNWQGATPLVIAQRFGSGRDVIQKLVSNGAQM
jgi:ankyrin repeat protein